MRARLAILILASVAAQANAGRYRTDLVLQADDVVPDGGRLCMNNAGDVLFSAYTNEARGIDALFLNSTPYTGGYGRAVGINDRGDVLWQQHIADPYNTDRWRVMKNHFDLSDSLGYGFYNALASSMNQAGQVAWTGAWIEGPDKTFVDTTDWGADVGVTNSYSTATDLNDRGQLLWGVRKGYWDTYLDGTNLTQAYTGGGGGVALNNNDDFVWLSPADSHGGPHVWRNYTDLTAAYARSGVYSEAAALNSSGHVLWDYFTQQEPYISEVMLDGVSVSAPVLGAGNGGVPVALNDHDDVLWEAVAVAPGGSFQGWQRIFVDGYDFTADVLQGQSYDWVHAWDMNQSGQVFWSAHINGKEYFYLSTPVPEPSMLLLAVPVLALLRRRR